VETFLAEDFPGRGRVEGMSVRLFNPDAGTWKIWWISTGNPGDIGTPVEGAWTGGTGQFFGDDELAGRKIRVQYEWTVHSPSPPAGGSSSPSTAAKPGSTTGPRSTAEPAERLKDRLSA